MVTANAVVRELDLPRLQLLFPLSHSHDFVGPALGLGPLAITPLLIFGTEFCPPSSWRARYLRARQPKSGEGLCMWVPKSYNERLVFVVTEFLCTPPLHLSFGQLKASCDPETVPSVYMHLPHRHPTP